MNVAVCSGCGAVYAPPRAAHGQGQRRYCLACRARAVSRNGTSDETGSADGESASRAEARRIGDHTQSFRRHTTTGRLCRRVSAGTEETGAPNSRPATTRVRTAFLTMCSLFLGEEVLPPSSVATRLWAVVQVRKRPGCAPQ